jgi:hypothetical protein
MAPGAIPGKDSRGRHDRFPHPGPLPGGEGDSGRAARDFLGKESGMHLKRARD